MADALTPDSTIKTSTVGGLLTSVKNSFSSLTNSFSAGGSAASGGGSTSSPLMSPFVWAGVLVVAAVVYFKKFRKPSRKGVRIR